VTTREIKKKGYQGKKEECRGRKGVRERNVFVSKAVAGFTARAQDRNCAFFSRLCFFGQEKSERELLLFSTQKQPERRLLANHNHMKDANSDCFCLFRE
jgi:hypothetical protein